MSEAQAELITDMYRDFLFSWLLGHEIGHLVLGHHLNAEHSVALDENQQSWGRHEETSADAFVLTRLSHQKQMQFGAFMTLSQMATSQYARLVDRQYKAQVQAAIDNGKEPYLGVLFPVEIRYRQDLHPPWLIRTLDMADTLFKKYPDMIDTSGFWERMRANAHPKRAASKNINNWNCAETLIGGSPESLREFSGNGDAETLDRLLEENELDTLLDRTDHFRHNMLAAGQEREWIEAYLAFLRAEILLRRGWPALALAEANRAADAYKRRYPSDLSLLLMHARAIGRIDPDPQSRASTIEALLPNIERSAQDVFSNGKNMSRQIALYYTDMWEILARGRSLVDPAVETIRSSLLDILVNHGFVSIADTMLLRWKREIERLPVQTSDATRENELLAFSRFASALGRKVDAIVAIREALKAINQSNVPAALPVKAFWKTELAQLLVTYIAAEECQALTREALAHREEIAAIVATESPENLDRAIGQVALAANEAGFCHMLGKRSQEGAKFLEYGLEKELSRKTPNERTLATIKHNLSQLYTELGQRKNALEYARYALDTRTRLGENPTLIENSRLAVAAALYFLGETEEAISLLKVWNENYTKVRDFRVPVSSLVMTIDGHSVSIGNLIGVRHQNEIDGEKDLFSYTQFIEEEW